MDPHTFRGDMEPTGADVYWRRRITVLTVVLVVVAIIVWACSAGDDEQPAQQGREHAAGPHAVAMAKAERTGGPAPIPGGAAVKTPRPTPKPSPRRRAGDPCRPSDLVLALQSERRAYPGGERPVFLLTLVNTSKLECTVDVGPRTLIVRITSGRDRVWSTADCVSGEGTERRKLKRGVPYVRMVEWDRRRSPEDCRARRPEARPGSYLATAHTKGVRSARAPFRLR